MGKKRLTIREDRLVDQIINPATVSQTQAAKAAGYSDASAYVIAAENLKKPHIQDAIERRKREVAKHSNVTPEQVIGATALRAYATIDDVLDDEGNFDIQKARKTGAVHLIKKINKTHTKYGTNVAVEFYSNESAQDRLGTYLGLEKAPQANDDRTRLMDAVDKIMKVENISFGDALAYVANKQKEGITLFNNELLAQVAREHNVELPQEIDNIQ